MTIEEYLDRQLYDVFVESEFWKAWKSRVRSGAIKDAYLRKRSYVYGQTKEHHDFIKSIIGTKPYHKWYFACGNFTGKDAYDGRKINRVISDMQTAITNRDYDNMFTVMTEDPALAIMRYSHTNGANYSLYIDYQYANSVQLLLTAENDSALEDIIVNVPLVFAISASCRDYVYDCMHDYDGAYEFVHWNRSKHSFIHGITLDVTKNVYEFGSDAGSSKSFLDISCQWNNSVPMHDDGLVITTDGVFSEGWNYFTGSTVYEIRRMIYEGLFGGVKWDKAKDYIKSTLKNSCTYDNVSYKVPFEACITRWFSKENCENHFSKMLKENGIDCSYRSFVKLENAKVIGKRLLNIT